MNIQQNAGLSSMWGRQLMVGVPDTWLKKMKVKSFSCLLPAFLCHPPGSHSCPRWRFFASENHWQLPKMQLLGTSSGLSNCWWKVNEKQTSPLHSKRRAILCFLITDFCINWNTFLFLFLNYIFLFQKWNYFYIHKYYGIFMLNVW